MKRVLVIVAVALAVSAPASAEIDFTISSVGIENAGGGMSDVVVVIDMRTHGPISANTTDATLRLDGVFHDAILIDYSIYEPPGCTYSPNWEGLGPACYDDPGCDTWLINGGMIPGDCALLIPGGVPLSCW